MGINSHLSDLFFNLDFEHCITSDAHGHFIEFNERALKITADWFLQSLQALGVRVPSSEELLDEFNRRV
jgi:hypothetical protein